MLVDNRPEGAMLRLRQSDEIPICPHCNAPIEEMLFRELTSTLGRRFVYFCSRCRKVLGVSHRKGFWMG